MDQVKLFDDWLEYSNFKDEVLRESPDVEVWTFREWFNFYHFGILDSGEF